MPRPPAGATGVGSGGTSRSTKTDDAINGPMIFVVRDLVDIGFLRNRFDTDPDAEPMRSLVISGVIHHDGTVIEVKTDARVSFDPRATMTKFLTAVRRGVEPDDEEVVDFNEVVGKPLQVKVKSTPVKNGQGFWLRISDPSALVEGTPVPEALQPFCTPTEEPFVWLPEEQLQLIQRRLGPTVQRGEEHEDRPPAGGDNAIAIPGSEITVAVWRDVAPVLRRVLDDRFGGDIRVMHDAFETEMQTGDPKAADVLGFLGPKGDDPEKIVFKFGGRTDPDALDLKKALEAREKAGLPGEGASPATSAVPPDAEIAPSEGEVDPTELPGLD